MFSAVADLILREAPQSDSAADLVEIDVNAPTVCIGYAPTADAAASISSEEVVAAVARVTRPTAPAPRSFWGGGTPTTVTAFFVVVIDDDTQASALAAALAATTDHEKFSLKLVRCR